jgi:hypothetical protein
MTYWTRQRVCDTELDMVQRLPCPRYSGQSGHATRSASLVNGIGPTKESTNGNPDARDVGTDREGSEALRLCTNDQTDSSMKLESTVEEDGAGGPVIRGTCCDNSCMRRYEREGDRP